MEEGILSRTLALNFGHGYAQEQYAVKTEGKSVYCIEYIKFDIADISLSHNIFNLFDSYNSDNIILHYYL